MARRYSKALAPALALASAFLAPAAPASEAQPKIVLAFLKDGQVLRGGRPVDEPRLKADLAALKKGDQVLLCMRAMNDKVSANFDRYVLTSTGEFDTKFLTKGRCPADPETQGKPAQPDRPG